VCGAVPDVAAGRVGRAGQRSEEASTREALSGGW
jgi:hypothetical protein